VRVLGRRLTFYLLVAIAAVTVDFLLPRVIPGSPLDSILSKLNGATLTKASLQALKEEFGGDTKTGLTGQYLHFWHDLFTGQLGVSTSEGMAPVTAVIRGALPWTLGLVGLATLLSFLLGTLIGVLVAWRRGTWMDQLLPITTFFQAAPYFFLAFLIIDLFAVKLGWFPSEGARGITDFPALNVTYAGDVLYHAALPAATIVIASMAGWIVGMRNVMVTTMDEDYVLIAQAKGLPKKRVVWYAARNAILPSVSSFSLAIGFVVSGALLTEVVFSYPGLGFILLTAVQEADYSLLQGIFLVITLAVLIVNLIADFVYVFLDPRTRQEA